MTFTHTFDYDDDQVFFAYSMPYTYTDLNEYLCQIQSLNLKYVKRNTLCRTIAGNKCEYLTITNKGSIQEDKEKQGIVLSARVHPGESNSSWIMKGVIDFLISDDSKASELRDKFVFKIIPMLNPDGVINGNYRCSLAGCDLNRRWKYPSESLHPTVFHTKQLIVKMDEERGLAMFCDIHGHSRRKNTFIYGNNIVGDDEACRIFPFLFSKVSQPYFSYDYSKFSVHKSKETTARIAIWKELGSKHANIFTYESSFCGPKPVKYEPNRGGISRAPMLHEVNYHFNTKDYALLGTNLCKAILLYKEESEGEKGLEPIIKEI
jgi:hypothetical protein